MIILVDFENTHVSGLDGYEYLNDTDTLVMYYSDENSAVTKGMVDDLKKHNVHVSLVKLLKQHSNALDMYIASTTGMFLETGEKICIVSKDKGYAAVRDFWHSLRGAEILLGETIKECFLNSEKIDDVRIKLCKERAQKAALVDSFATMNTIPTRPTLSRGSQRRKNKNINFTLVSEPASLIPNPLMMATPADQLAKQMQSAPIGDTARESMETDNKKDPEGRQNDLRSMSGDRRSAEQTDSNRRSSVRDSEEKTGRESRKSGASKANPQESRRWERNKSDTEKEVISHGGYDGIGKVNEASRIENLKRMEAQDKPKAIIKSEPEKTAIITHTEPKTALTKAEPKFDPNRMQYIYDPVSRSMKKVGADSREDMSQTSNDNVEETDNIVSPVSATNVGDHTENADDISPEAAPSDSSDEIHEKGIDAEEQVKETTDASPKGVLDNKATDVDEADASLKTGTVADAPENARETAEITEASEAENTSQIDTGETAQDTAATGEKAGRKKSTAGKSGRKAGRPRKSADKDTAADETTSEASPVSENAEEVSAATTRKRGRKPSSKNGAKKVDAGSSKKSASQKTKNAENIADAKAESTEAKVTDTDTSVSEVPSVTPEEAVNKYGLTANTLHTYYVRLMKAYGKEQGRALYDSSKKMVQEDIKKRKPS